MSPDSGFSLHHLTSFSELLPSAAHPSSARKPSPGGSRLAQCKNLDVKSAQTPSECVRCFGAVDFESSDDGWFGIAVEDGDPENAGVEHEQGYHVGLGAGCCWEGIYDDGDEGGDVKEDVRPDHTLFPFSTPADMIPTDVCGV